MLTKQDLNSIRGVVREEIKSELIPVRKDITNLHEDMKVVKNDVKKLDRRLTRTINFFDNAELDTRAKVNKTRKDLGLSEIEFAY